MLFVTFHRGNNTLVIRWSMTIVIVADNRGHKGAGKPGGQEATKKRSQKAKKQEAKKPQSPEAIQPRRESAKKPGSSTVLADAAELEMLINAVFTIPAALLAPNCCELQYFGVYFLDAHLSLIDVR